jgi:hypothetical protein
MDGDSGGQTGGNRVNAWVLAFTRMTTIMFKSIQVECAPARW